jgi:hypothetical protein
MVESTLEKIKIKNKKIVGSTSLFLESTNRNKVNFLLKKNYFKKISHVATKGGHTATNISTDGGHTTNLIFVLIK